MTLEPREFSIVGESFGDRQQIIKKYVHTGTSFLLRREPENPNDPYAIAIEIQTPSGPEIIGYINKEDAAELAPQIDNGLAIPGCVHGVYGGTPQRPHLGVVLDLYLEDGSILEEYEGPPIVIPPLVTPVRPTVPSSKTVFDRLKNIFK